MSGLILIDGLGIYVKFREAVLARVLGLSSAYLLNTGCLCPSVGCLTVLLGFVGWYGATRENRGTLLFVSWICTHPPKLPPHPQVNSSLHLLQTPAISLPYFSVLVVSHFELFGFWEFAYVCVE